MWSASIVRLKLPEIFMSIYSGSFWVCLFYYYYLFSNLSSDSRSKISFIICWAFIRNNFYREPKIKNQFSARKKEYLIHFWLKKVEYRTLTNYEWLALLWSELIFCQTFSMTEGEVKMVAWLKLGHVAGIIPSDLENWPLTGSIANATIELISGLKTITQSGLKTPVWEMEPKAFPNTHDLIWFDLIFSKI